ncbi:DMT family transporter [candidate division CSSED10-310 bacterium]|uniref:DMT family transporter n=1 Tax=candidate division CSSED10-310 bacterium TaxID=2855610 RepID=A0ABV6Z283_UNCC1
MKTRTLKSDVLLLLAAIIWGFAFVAQRVGMEYVGPFIFNGIRFALGSLVLVPYLVLQRKKRRSPQGLTRERDRKILVFGGGLTGIILFLGATLQQVGIVYTTAGKAGFLTGLYVIIVPLIGIFLGQRILFGTWLGALSAAVGLYLLCMTGKLSLSLGDSLVFVSALFWAVHCHILSWLSPKVGAIRLAFLQFTICSLFSMLFALLYETISLQGIFDAAVPILYGGLLSVGVAYTLQVIAQKEAHPSHAAIILCLESAFAVLGGWLILNEMLSFRGLIGCGFMFAGMILSQLQIENRSIRAIFD